MKTDVKFYAVALAGAMGMTDVSLTWPAGLAGLLVLGWLVNKDQSRRRTP